MKTLYCLATLVVLGVASLVQIHIADAQLVGGVRASRILQGNSGNGGMLIAVLQYPSLCLNVLSLSVN
jgi:hypothetical protein